MKKHRGKPIIPITSEEIERYSEEHTTSESEEIRALIASSDAQLEYIDMLSGNLVGQLLKIIIKVSGAKKILEIGTFTGYSAIMMAEALPENGTVTTIEMNLKYMDISQNHFDKSNYRDRIQLLRGNAQKLIPALDDVYDLIYLDGDKLRYSLYFDLVLPKLQPGGLLIVDNVLWDGMVLNPEDPKSQAIARSSPWDGPWFESTPEPYYLSVA